MSHDSRGISSTGRRRRPLLEGLEARIVMTASVGVFETPIVQGLANIVQGPNSSLYHVNHTAGEGHDSIQVLGPNGPAGTIALPQDLNGSVFSVAVGSDGNYWLLGSEATSFGGGDQPATLKITKVTPAGSATVYNIPNAGSSSQPATAPQITAGPDGALWFPAGYANSFVGRISTSGVVTKYAIGRDLSILIPNASDAGVYQLAAITLAGGSDFTGVGEASVSGLLATFKDPGLNPLPPSAYSSPYSTIVPDGTGGFDVHGSVPANQPSYQVRVYKDEGQGLTAATTVGGLVTGVGADASGNTRILVSASGPAGPGVLNLPGTIDFGDGSAPATGAQVFATPKYNGLRQVVGYGFSFQLDHAYPRTPAVHVAHASILGPNSTRLDSSGLIAVNAPALTGPAAVNFTVAEFQDPSTTTSNAANLYSATIDWGDLKSVLPIQGTHVYSGSGVYRATVVISQAGRADATIRSTVAVDSDATLARFVNNAFTQLIGHAADPASLNAWVGQLQSGAITGQQMAQIHELTPVYGSDLFDQQNGGTDAGILQALYAKAVGRPVDAGALGGYKKLLASGQMTRTQVAYRTLTSIEYRQALVQFDYQTYPGRLATSAEVSAAIADLVSGTTDEQVVAMIVGSNEYENKP